jgi:RNA polymerase sigma factor (sigma-70 family)
MNSASQQSMDVQVTDKYDSVPTRKSLLSRLRDAGDDASWRTFFDTYWLLIYNVARKSGLSDDAAQEVVQETVISVARKMPDFRYDPKTGSFKQWLLLITRRRIHDHLRITYRMLPQIEPDVARQQVEEMVAPALTPDAQIDAVWEEEWRENIFQAALARVRQRVNPKHFQVFDYCVLRNVKAPEVARMLGLNAAQVYLMRHRVSRAVKHAAAEIEAELKRS